VKSARNSAVDAVKLLAMFGVVIIHLAPSTPAAELMSQLFSAFAVPFFLMISLYYFMGKLSGSGALSVSALRLDRLYIPYAVWTIIYLALRIFKYQVQHKSLELDFIPALFYGGSGVQMYFLPLLLLFQFLVLGVFLMLRNPSRRFAGLVFFCSAATYGWIGMHENYFGFTDCLIRGVPYVLGAFLLQYAQINPSGRRMNLFFGGLLAALLVMASVGGYHPDWLGILGGSLAGYSLAALTLNLPLNLESRVWRFLLTCSYGIFLSHVVFLETFEFVAPKFGCVLTPYSFVSKLLVGSLICLGCLGFISLVRRYGLLAYLFLGETPKAQRA
jgi:peptidoglycan/LPS O-acetylase OafA/YrhL